MNKLVLITAAILGFTSNTWAEGGDADYEALRKRQVETLAAYSARVGRGGEDATYWSRMFQAAEIPSNFDVELRQEQTRFSQYFDVRGGQNKSFSIDDKFNMARAVAAQEVSRDYEWIKNNSEAFEKRVQYLVDLRGRAEFADYDSPAWRDFQSYKAYTKKLLWANTDAEKILNRRELLKQIDQLRRNVGATQDLVDLKNVREELVREERALASEIKNLNAIRIIPEMPKFKSAVSILRRGIPGALAVGGIALTTTLLNGSTAHAEPANTVGGSTPSQLDKHDDDAFGVTGAAGAR